MNRTLFVKWATTLLAAFVAVGAAQAADSPTPGLGGAGKKPNIVILMTDDTGWTDFGYISGGGATLGHPTPNVDRSPKKEPTSPVGTGRQAAPPAEARS